MIEGFPIKRICIYRDDHLRQLMNTLHDTSEIVEGDSRNGLY